jgi:hypothetical protein
MGGTLRVCAQLPGSTRPRSVAELAPRLEFDELLTGTTQARLCAL